MSTTTPPQIDIETAKKNAATRAVHEHFSPTFTHVGIGSGSTIVHVVNAICALDDPRTKSINFVPTGYQSRQVIYKAGLKDIKFDSLPENTLLDVAFDGADEVDEELNCIKGGGACLYQEKLVATQARKFVCVADHRKLQPRLLTKWPSIPVEVEPLAAKVVRRHLIALGSEKPELREGHIQKAGPIKTDQDNFIIDAPFPPLLLKSDQESEGRWRVEALAKEIKGIEGVLSVGIFCGVNGEEGGLRGWGGEKPVAAYFGMADGEVVVREAGKGAAKGHVRTDQEI